MNAYETVNWGVRIIGPDSVLAASSFDEAVEKCNEINSFFVWHIKPKSVDENYPIIYAQVDEWENLSSGQHDPENTDWSNIC